MSEKFEKAKKGLACCERRGYCEGHCPYYEPEKEALECTSELAHDALDLISHLDKRIKELSLMQVARVMTLEEVKAIPLKRDHVWVERLVKECYREVFGKTTLFCLQKLEHFGYEDDPDDGGPSEGVFWITPTKQFYKTRWDEYGKRFVCWTFKPTDEQRKAVPWNG